MLRTPKKTAKLTASRKALKGVPKAKKLHPADITDREAIAKATEFSAFLRRSPTEAVKQMAPSLKEAVEKADAIRAANLGRDVVVYALIEGGGAIPVPKEMQDSARGGPSPNSAKPKAGKAALAPKLTKEQRALKQPKLASEPRAKAEMPLGKWAALEDAAKRGEVPAAPDFSARTHARFRKKLDELKVLVQAGDLKGLKTFHINPISSSPKALDKFRNLAVIALEARRAAEKKSAA